MHIEGVLRLRKSPVRTIHLASILAQTGSPTIAGNISRDAAVADGAR
jgi:hypothetical protein